MTNNAKPNLAGKTILITGANTGIGKAAALALAGMGAQVVLGARDAAKGEAAVEEVRKTTGNQQVELLLADFQDLSAVRVMAEQFLQHYQRLDVLINNAGLLLDHRTETAAGHETMFAVNHLAPFLLTHLLRPLLEASAPARVVNLSSGAHRRAKLDFDDLHSHKRFWGFAVYGKTKLANILFTHSLAQRLNGTGVSANSCHPGVVATRFAMDGDTTGIFRYAYSLSRPFLLTPEKGARTTVHLASSPEVEGVSGEYFYKSKIARPSTAARDDATAEQLWDVSAELTGVK